MPVHNSDVEEIFNEIADLLEIEGANPFRVRAYRNAARTIGSLSRNVRDMVEEDEDLTELPGIGEDLAGKIETIVKTGTVEQLEKLRARTPPGLTKLLDVSGLGPKRVQRLREELGVESMADLERVAKEHKIRELDGFGEKIEQGIIEDIEESKEKEQRTLLMKAEQVAEPLVTYLKASEVAGDVVVAGSYRRRKETVGDLDILATSDDGAKMMEHFVSYEDVEKVRSRGETRSTVILKSGMQVDLRVVAQESYGAAVFYFTGSKSHNIAIRNIAIDHGMKVNEYGVFEDEERIAGETEEEIYELFDLPFIPPELREDRGEIEAAQEGRLPQLVTLDDVRGDLQMHTTGSDGRNTLREMAEKARSMGYEYIAITDHSSRVAVTQGFDAEELPAWIDEIHALDEELDGIRLLTGIEVDVLEDGSLDLPDDVLERLDVVVAAVHSHFDLPQEKQTERIVKAFDHLPVNILAHPTGRRIGERAPYDVDMSRVIEAAAERGCILEINAQPSRLDLDDVDAKMAKEAGAKVVISTDAHSTDELEYMRYGVGQARRGWLEGSDVVNVLPWEELEKVLKRG